MKRQLNYSQNENNIKVPKLITFGNSFRKKLKTNDGLKALREFVSINKERDVVTEYINSGGSAKEIIELLKIFNGKEDLTAANTIFSALYCLIVKTIDDLLLIQKNVEEACEEVLCTYTTLIQNMLTSNLSTTSHRKVILKLLSGMIRLSNGLTKKILTLFSISPKVLKLFIISRSSNSSVKLRNCFIRYLLSFLETENTIIISELLQKKGLLTCIIPDLMNDQPEIIILVLNTFLTKIVENLKIPKTLKMHTFNTMILRSIFKLYDYKIPELHEGTNKHKEDLSDINRIIRESVHSLLLLLCTSSKKGILFREHNLKQGKSPNQLILTLLEDIKSPWKDELKCHLVTEILKVCPEFIKIVFNKLECYLSPSVSEEWIKVITFMKQVIKTQDLNIESVSDAQMFNSSISLVFPAAVQKLFHYFTDNMIHPHPIIRYHIVTLLMTILNKIASILKQPSVGFPESKNSTLFLKELIEQFLAKNLVPCLYLINAWNVGINFISEGNLTNNAVDNCNLNYPDINEYYISLADVLLYYKNLCPMSFNQLYMEENLDMISVDINNADFLFKQAQLIFHIFNLKPGQERFFFVMKQFIEYYISNENSSEDVLKEILLTTGFFDGFEEEIVIWLHCLKEVSVDNATIIAELFIDVLKIMKKKITKYMKNLTMVMQDECNEDSYLKNTHLLETLDNFFDINEEFEQISPSYISLSPVIPAFLHYLQSNEKSKNLNDVSVEVIKSFVLSVLTHVLHLQSTHQGLLKMINKYSSSYIESTFFKYINFWSRDDFKLKLFEYPFKNDTIISHLYLSLLQGNSPKEILPHIPNLTEKERILLWNTCTFYAVQLNNKQVLDEKKLEAIVSTFNTLCDTLQSENQMMCLKLFLTNPNFINNFYLKFNAKYGVLSIILLKVIENIYKNSKIIPVSYTKLLSPYRLKLIQFLLKKMNHNKHIRLHCNQFTIEDIIKLVMISAKTIINLLKVFIHLPINLLIDETNMCLTEWANVIACLLKMSATNLEIPLEHENVSLLISKIVTVLKKNINVDILEESMIIYIQSFPHHLNFISGDLVNELLVYHQTIDKLGLYLLPYHPTYVQILENKTLQNINKIDIDTLFEIISKIESVANAYVIRSAIYDNHLRDFNNWMNEDCYWLGKNLVLVMNIFQDFAKTEDCLNLCKYVESKWDAIKLNDNLCLILRIIYEKANEIELYERLLISKLNEILSSSENMSWLCVIICDIAEKLENVNFLFYPELWNQFVKLSLKISLKMNDSTLMRTLKIISNKSLTQDESSNVNMIFQMTVSHSEFMNVMLSESDMKCELIEFFLHLITKNTSLMSSNHVPLLLGAYKATLSKSDQLLLQILQWYEESGIRLSDCRPYLWGEAAVIHHSVRAEISLSLKRQPQANEVLELLDMNIVKNTIKHFPLNRDLQSGKCIQFVEDKIYDLSFILPLMSHLLAPESRLSVQKFTRSGALSLILVALSSDISNVRMAAFHCLQRFHLHLSSREKEIQIWDHFLNGLKNGVSYCNQNNKENDQVPKLPCVVTVFLAYMCLIISEPLHSLFVPLTNFLLAKPTIDINIVPNFLVLYYSMDIKQKEHQEWILKVLRDGMRSTLDWKISQKSFLFKLLQQFYVTSASNETINILILSVIDKALHMQDCKVLLVTKCGFLSWISYAIRNMFNSNPEVLQLIINILKSLVSVKNSSNIIPIAVILLRKLFLRKKIHRKIIEDLLQILATLYSSCKDKDLLSENDIHLIIKFASPYLDLRWKKMYGNCLRYKSVLGVSEMDENINKYVISIVRQFVNNYI